MIGLPKALRSLVYAIVCSIAASMAAIAWMAITSRSCGSCCMSWMKPVPSAAEQVVGRHAHVVEEQLRGVLRLHADLLEIAAALEASRLGLDHDQRGALGAELGIGLGDDDHEVGELAVA